MNRRGFFKTLAVATAGFAILPPATTYQRVWKAASAIRVNPAWIDAPYEAAFIFDPRAFAGTWKFITDPHPVAPIRYTLNNGVFEPVPYRL